MVITYASLLAVLLGAGDARPIDFDTQIAPIFTKAGCNAGSCHGAAAGRGGFKLSLYGSEPAADYEAIVMQLECRRINLVSPDQSLLLLKATEQMEHGGGLCLQYDGEAVERLLAWIDAGAPRAARRHLTDLEIDPVSQVVEKTGQAITLRATARFSDGCVEDVTRWTVFTPEDAASVEIDETAARAKLLRRGRHIVLARYLDRVIPLQLIVPLSDDPIDLSRESRHNFIDDFVYEMLETLRLPVSPPADDTTMCRRIHLDLTGTLPSADAVQAYGADRNREKAARLVARLMQTDEFIDYWTYKFAKLLRIRSQPQDTKGARTYYDWLRAQFASGAPYDQMARQLLTALGDSHELGPPNFYRTVGDARAQAEFVSELLLGVRLRCANCHNHPLDRWTQDDYHGFAAIFARIERGQVIKISDRGKVTHPRTGQPARARIPGERFLTDAGDQRESVAAWITRKDNPYFARAMVNRLWKSLMGRGLVEPTDDMRATNPATHAKLLQHLAEDFVQHGYDFRRTIALICTSVTYGRSTNALPDNRADDRYYSHALVRPLEPEVLADALAGVTGVWDRYGSEPEGTRAVTLFDARIKSESLDILGRCSREESCETTSADSGGGLSRKLHMMNGPLINKKITDPRGRLRQLIVAERTCQQIVEEFYLRSLSRRPSHDEQTYWDEQFAKGKDRQEMKEIAEDFVWSLLTCREFVTNH